MSDEVNLDKKIRAFIDKYEIDSAVSEALGSYVYILADTDGKPFYIGKGTGRRVLQHFEETVKDVLNDKEKINKIKRVFENGEPKIKLLRTNLMTENGNDREAFLVEQVAIDLLGMNNLVNEVSGHHSNQFGIRYLDDFINEHKSTPLRLEELPGQVLAVKIKKYWDDRDWRNSRTDSSLYDACRRAWKCSEGRLLEKDGSVKLKYVLAVSDEIIREVYSVHSWHKDEEEPNKWRFDGSPSRDECCKKLIGKNVSGVIIFGSGQSIAYSPEA